MCGCVCACVRVCDSVGIVVVALVTIIYSTTLSSSPSLIFTSFSLNFSTTLYSFLLTLPPPPSLSLPRPPPFSHPLSLSLSLGANLVLEGSLSSIFGPESGISFGSWISAIGPLCVLNLFILWVILVLYFLGPTKMFLGLGRGFLGSDWRSGVVSGSDSPNQNQNQNENGIQIIGPSSRSFLRSLFDFFPFFKRLVYGSGSEREKEDYSHPCEGVFDNVIDFEKQYDGENNP